MQLPDFDTFLKAIDQNAFEEYINGSEESQIICVDNLLAEGNINELVNLLYQRFAQDAARISQAYLFAYHSWLQQQLAQEES